MRQLVALGVGILVLLLFVVGINGCLNSRKERALKDYNRDVTSIVESSRQASEQLFETLNGGGAANDLQVAVNEIRLVTEADVKRADGFDVPGEMKPAQRYLMLVLNFRSSGVKKIADELRNVGANAAAATAAVSKIAGQMEVFLSSDVVYNQRVQPLIKDALDEAKITGQTIPDSKFLPSIGWLDPVEIADRLGADIASSARTGGQVAPGLHGHGLVSLAAGGVKLTPGDTINRVPASSNLAFTVVFQNQGDNNESAVKVRLRIEGGGIKPIRLEKTVNQTAAKKEVPVTIPLETTPPIGRAVTVTAEVAAVPGEKKTDNNKQSYTVLFTR